MQSLVNFFIGNPYSIWINLTIFVFFLSALISIIYRWLELNREEKAFQIIQDEYSKINNIDSLDSLWEIIEKINPRTIISKRLKNIHQIRLKNGEINVEFIGQINENVPFPIANYARQLSSTLVLMGLMGTIIGLSLALGKMGRSIEGFELQALKDNLSMILSGMNTAFSTSVTGLVCTFILIISIYLYNRKLIHLSNAFEEFLVTKVLSQYQASNFVDNLDKLLELLEQEFNKTKILSNRLLKATDNATSQYDALLSVSSAFENASQNIIHNFKETSLVQQEIRAISQEFTDIAKNISEHSKDFSSKYSVIIEKLQSALELMQVQSFEINKLLEEGRESRKDIDQLSNLLENGFSVFEESVNFFRNSLHGFNEIYQDTQGKLLSEIQSFFEDNQNQFSELIQNISAEAALTNKKVGEAINGVNDLYASTYKNIEELFKSFIDKMKSELQSNFEAQESLTRDLSQIIDTLKETTKVIKENAWGNEFYSIIKENSDKVEKYSNALAEIVVQLTDVSQGLKQLDLRETNILFYKNIEAMEALRQTLRRKGFVYWFRYLFSFIPVYRKYIDPAFER